MDYTLTVARDDDGVVLSVLSNCNGISTRLDGLPEAVRGQLQTDEVISSAAWCGEDQTRVESVIRQVLDQNPQYAPASEGYVLSSDGDLVELVPT